MKHAHTLSIGIAPYEILKERTLAIARGDYKPGRNDPKIWFSSMESLAQVLSTQNQLLLEMIARAKPQSITKLSEISGRHKSNLSRTLKTMERYGLVSLKHQESGEIAPQVTFDNLRVHLELERAHRPCC